MTLDEIIDSLISAAEYTPVKENPYEPLVASWLNHGARSPQFDLRPRDFLTFAEDELGKEATVSRINCVNHLKRAIECQVDTYLYAWNMLDYARKKMPAPRGLPGKLELLKSLGLLNTRSVTRLNQMRNKVEHEYAIPDIQDLDVFYELVETSIALLERAVATVERVEISTGPGEYMQVQYYMDRPRVVFQIENQRPTPGVPDYTILYEAALDDNREAFIQCFRILSLLGDTVIYLLYEESLVAKLRQIKTRAPSTSVGGLNLLTG